MNDSWIFSATGASDVMPAGEVIGSYHDLWHVEQSFRMSKTDMRAPADVPPDPRRDRGTPDHRVTALAISREVQARTGLAICNVIKQLRPLRSATITINGTTQTFHPAIPADQQAMLDALHGPKLTH